MANYHLNRPLKELKAKRANHFEEMLDIDYNKK